MKNTPMRSAMILAAGLGTRLKPFTESVPKPLLPVFSVPLLQFTFDWLAHFKVSDAAMNFHHLPEVFRNELKQTQNSFQSLTLSDESAALLGSGGGVRTGSALLKSERFFQTNADNLVWVDLDQLETFHLKQKEKYGTEMTLVIRKKRNFPENYTEIIFDEKTGKLSSLGTKSADAYYYSGVALIEKSVVSHLDVGKEYDFVETVLRPKIADQKVSVFVSDDFWVDIGNPKLWSSTHFSLADALQRNLLPEAWKKRILSHNAKLEDGGWFHLTNERAEVQDKSLTPPFYVGKRVDHSLFLNHEIQFRGKISRWQ